VKLTLL
jgi:ATP-binding cassette subfamily B protein